MTTKKETKERKQSNVKIRFAHELKRTLIKRIEGKIVHLEYIYGDGRNEPNELFKVESHGKYGSQSRAGIKHDEAHAPMILSPFASQQVPIFPRRIE